MKLCLYCTCMGTLSPLLSEKTLREALDSDIRLHAVDRLCDEACVKKAVSDLAIADATSSHIVAAACSERARGMMAFDALKKALPTAHLALADIREGSLWHASQNTLQGAAIQSAALIRMAFARTAHPKSCEPPKESQSILVIGAGPAGIAAASSLAALGLPVTLAERRPEPGGMAILLGKLFPYMTASSTLIQSLPLTGVKTRMGCTVSALRPENGAYMATFHTGTEEYDEAFSAVILATGAQPILPQDAFEAKKRKGVLSQMELDTLLSAIEGGKKESSALLENYVFVQCVHARSEEKPYCSAICCGTAVKNALRIKALRPEAQVTIVNRQMVMPGIALEALYRKAMQSGVRFAHIEALSDLRVEGKDRVQAVVLPALESTGERRFACEALVCSTPLMPAQTTRALIAKLNVRTDALGFLQGHEPAHPLESAAEGVFVCGSARWPASVEQSMTQGKACAVLAARYVQTKRMPMDELSEPGPCAVIDKARCSGCGRCVEACPHGALAFADTTVAVTADLCRRCGVCQAVCPSGAASLPAYSPSPREILACVRDSRQRSLS